tara:strand:+ start:877 stop:1977 length:1101 start_codon:yes stop_codon:yes gene_type:complete
MNAEHDEIALDDITIDDVITGDTGDAITDGIDLPDAEPPTEEIEDELGLEEESEEESEDDEEDEVDPEGHLKDDSDDQEDDSDEDEVPTVVSEVLEKLGYDVDEEYDDTPEGLAAMTKDVASQMADDRLDDVLGNFPLVKQHLEYVMQGGESQEFMNAHDPGTDYNKFELAEADVASQRVILSNYFGLKGHDKEFINELLEDYEDSGKLHSKATAAKDALGKHQEQEREQLYEQQREQSLQSHKEQEEFWDGVAGIIENSQEFKGINIPEKEKGKFFNYISKPVDKNGTTQRDLDHTESDMESKLAMDYLMYKGFDLKSLISTKAKTQSAKSLRDKLSSSASSLKSARKTARRNKNFNVDDLDLDI